MVITAVAGRAHSDDGFRSFHPEGVIRMTIHLYPAPGKIVGSAEQLELHEKSRYRAAARHARRLYSGSLGELVHRELTAYADFGYRFASDALIARLATEVLAAAPRPSRSGKDEDHGESLAHSPVHPSPPALE